MLKNHIFFSPLPLEPKYYSFSGDQYTVSTDPKAPTYDFYTGRPRHTGNDFIISQERTAYPCMDGADAQSSAPN